MVCTISYLCWGETSSRETSYGLQESQYDSIVQYELLGWLIHRRHLLKIFQIYYPFFKSFKTELDSIVLNVNLFSLK